MTLPMLPEDFDSTRESLRALACYVMSPAYKARTGHIGLRPVGEGFGTPPFDDGSLIVVAGDRLARVPGDSIAITTLRAGAIFVGVDLSPDPGVGHDLPPYEPDADLSVDRDASLALGSWYSLGQRVFEELRATFDAGSISEAQLWPEHFDFAVTVTLGPGTLGSGTLGSGTLGSGAMVNVGFSPGDGFEAEPYVYVGPQLTDGLSGPFWNAPFGAVLPYRSLAPADGPAASALAFIAEGLSLLEAPR